MTDTRCVSSVLCVQVMDGEFQEGQERQVCIEKISRPIGEVVLQQELDIVSSLTKDNLLDAFIALDYLQFDTDQIFTPGSNKSLLWRIHRQVSVRKEIRPSPLCLMHLVVCQVVVEGWLADHQLANNLLDSFSRYPFVARFIHWHPDICAALRQSLRKRPDVIRDQWRRLERGEAEDDAVQAAVSLVASLADAISYGTIDVSRDELGQFITKATGSTSLSAAYGKTRQNQQEGATITLFTRTPCVCHGWCLNLFAAAVFESDGFSLRQTATVQPFAGGWGGAITCMGFEVILAGLPPPFAAPPRSRRPAGQRHPRWRCQADGGGRLVRQVHPSRRPRAGGVFRGVLQP